MFCFFLFTNLLVLVKLDYPPNFNFLGKPLLGEKCARTTFAPIILSMHSELDNLFQYIVLNNIYSKCTDTEGSGGGKKTRPVQGKPNN